MLNAIKIKVATCSYNEVVECGDKIECFEYFTVKKVENIKKSDIKYEWYIKLKHSNSFVISEVEWSDIKDAKCDLILYMENLCKRCFIMSIKRCHGKDFKW